MAGTEAAIRQAIVARIATLGGDWKESKFAPDVLGRDAASVAHQVYSVDLASGRTTGGRQRRTMLQTETVVVRFMWRIAPKDQLVSYDAALDAELVIIRHLSAAGWTSTFQLAYVSTSRSTTETGEWRRHEITFNALFYLSLE